MDVILPCLDEAPALPWVLERMPAGFRAIVVDNGSTDGSERLARSLGGFWWLGLRVPDPALVRGVPMSTANTGASQRARLHAAGLCVADLPQLRDVDTAEDAVAVARQAPRSRFAAQVRELAPLLGPATATHRAGGAVREQV